MSDKLPFGWERKIGDDNKVKYKTTLSPVNICTLYAVTLQPWGSQSTLFRVCIKFIVVSVV